MDFLDGFPSHTHQYHIWGSASLRKGSKTKSETSEILVQPELQKTYRADQDLLLQSLTEGFISNTRQQALKDWAQAKWAQGIFSWSSIAAGERHYSQVWFMVGRSKRDLSGRALDQNRERKQNLSHSLKQVAAFLMCRGIYVNFMQLPWTQATWWHLFPMCWQRHQLLLHLDFPRDARKQLRCQSRNYQPHSQCQCKTTGSGHHPVNQANPQPQGEKQLCILQNLLGYFLGQKCGFTFHFIQL